MNDSTILLRGRRFVSLACERCRPVSINLIAGITLALPEARRFWHDHPRIHILPEETVWIDGRQSLVVRYGAVDSLDTLDAVVRLDTLHIRIVTGLEMIPPVTVDVRDLVKRYKDGMVANDRLSLQVRRGEIFCLLGPNGAGKTTLVMQILGLLEPTAGQILVDGIDVVAHPDRVKEFASYMPQTRIAMRNLEVERALYTTGRLRSQSDKAARAQVEVLIERLELRDHRRQYLDRLSGGLMRVAAFAMALMGNPRLIVLDEPTNELDPIRRRCVWDYVRDIGRSGDVTCLLVTHNVLEAERAVDRVAMVDRGRVVALGTPGELKARLGEDVRLEVVLRSESIQDGSSVASRDRLATLGRLVELRAGHYAVFVPREGVGSAVDAVLTDLATSVDDFRLAPPSLEDVYIHLAGQKIGGE